MVDTLAKVVSDQIHVAQVLVGVFDKISMLLLYLQFDPFLVVDVFLLSIWQLLLFDTLNNGFSKTLIVMVLERSLILNVLLNINHSLLIIEECLISNIHRLDLLLNNHLVLDTVPNLILDFVLNAG